LKVNNWVNAFGIDPQLVQYEKREMKYWESGIRGDNEIDNS
jgi:hypothetical protein